MCDRELSSKPRIMKSNLPLMKVEKNSNKLKRARYEMTFLFVVNNEDILIKGFPFYCGFYLLFRSFFSKE